jgi:hypothetical protein
MRLLLGGLGDGMRGKEWKLENVLWGFILSTVAELFGL